MKSLSVWAARLPRFIFRARRNASIPSLRQFGNSVPLQICIHPALTRGWWMAEASVLHPDRAFQGRLIWNDGRVDCLPAWRQAMVKRLIWIDRPQTAFELSITGPETGIQPYRLRFIAVDPDFTADRILRKVRAAVNIGLLEKSNLDRMRTLEPPTTTAGVAAWYAIYDRCFPRLTSGISPHAPSMAPHICTMRTLLEDWDIRSANALAMFRNRIRPALDTTGASPASPTDDELIPEHSFGNIPRQPSISVIIPLYGRCDFIRYQCACFANDPFFMGDSIELIYALDDPAMADDCQRIATNSWQGHGVPFRLLLPPRNRGFAGINNLAARHARGQTLILLNSDVFPVSPGWAQRLEAFFEQVPQTGVVGARLLLGDDTLQHDGMVFERIVDHWSLWFPIHPGKGAKPPATRASTASVPAITGACLAIRRKLYLELGGLDEGYILGDFEDADLCMRIRERGLVCLIDHSVVLQHLERMSQNLFPVLDWKFKVTLANAIRFNERWGDVLDRAASS